MPLTSPIVSLLLLAACLAAFSRPGLARADAVPIPARTVEGIAATQTGKPLAHVTLYLFGLPPGETDMIKLGDQSTVVTDDRGHFVWQVPAALPPLSDYIGVRPISCYALAADRSTARFRLVVRPDWHGTSAEAAARDLLERATRPCATKWQTGGAHPLLSVIAPDMAVVKLSLRGPDGLPLRAQEVQVVSAGLWSDHEGAAVYTGRTDDAGTVRMRWYPGALRLQVFAAGLGFGSTGTFETLPGRSAAPAVPPLAPFTRLSGTVAAALVKPGATVHLEDFSSNDTWYAPRAIVAAGGRWTLDGVLPGPHRLVLDGGNGESEPVAVTVAPGEHLGGLTIGPRKPLSPVAALAVSLLGGARTLAGSPPGSKPVVRGRVMDLEGRPVAGADIYADFSYSGINGGAQNVVVVKSDAAGRYIISDPTGGGRLQQVYVRLVAHLPGSPMAFGDEQSEKDSASGVWPDVRLDLVLPGLHSGLTVRVLQGSKPLPNVPVELTADGGRRSSGFFFRGEDRGAAALALRKLLAPSAQTGPDGAAHFADLAPGLWSVAANHPNSPWLIKPMPLSPFNVSGDVVVRAGESLTYTVAVRPPPGEVAFRVLAPDGLPPAGLPVALSAATAQYPNYGNFSPTSDGAGNQRATFFAPGLFQITARFGDTPVDLNALVGPFNEGTALVAVSLATPATRPVVIPTRRYGPASIRVRLEDARGRPTRGTVVVGDAPSGAGLGGYAASADARGLVVFPNMPEGDYKLTARLAGLPGRAALGGEGVPFPSDAALLAGTGQPLPQAVHIQAGVQAAVTFRPQPIGYLRLHIAAPPAQAKNYYFDGRLASEQAFLDTRLDPRTGEFLVGPLPAGRRTFRLFRLVSGQVAENVSAGTTMVTVMAGQVARAALVPHEPPGPTLLLESVSPSGTVLLMDGKTPAWGARAGIFTADRPYPLRMVRTDARGHLTITDQWRGATFPWKPTPGGPAGPVVVAWLPGANGAVIVPYAPGQDARLVLPAAISLHGRVTAGGLSVLGLPSSFRVKAAYQGRGALNEALSVEATAQSDGTFELAGLTPGTYQVQAARDDIWLSQTQTLTVGAGLVPAMALDIAPPGAAVVLHLVDGAGRPLAGRMVNIARPAGPLTASLWPTGLAANGAGDLRVDGLEVGRHHLMVSGVSGEEVGFSVPTWTPDTPPTVQRVMVRGGQ